ncbi:MAG TPA: C40 family peptidase [Giesbergeria sp.]|jgi:cell wall-associated NlpC family hydrolase|uniref:C40 family peptidase n=1 Tax=Acidovorax sp. 210-6 TaxID=2699468 RepID=UPI00138A3FB4|nr:C40 family peptidase [Acidovorax sp. 210-6]MBL8364888.1 C40 family peptidase [Comamonas sp.]MCK6416568.1 C40 family peptidase [Giesbergeria sp.]MCL4770095.1 C40 family peptidase [Burkholderiaceae bacterium]NCU66124.1 C40 family peptidase [Acidovorax sp. 210-6]HMZ86088.1 C40 family peptidase [Giesbergeria sp.]
MSRWLYILVLALSTTAHAAPGSAPTEAQEPFQWDKNLRSQLAELGHNVADQAHVVADRTTDLVTTAMGFLGVPYRRGGNSAETGFDCSGFVRNIYQQTLGLLLPRQASEQAASTEKIDKKDLQPGDLVFFNTMRRAFSHVGIYVGDGKFIHSPRSGGKVRVEDMQESYWQKRFNGARRVAPEAQAGNAQAAALQAAAAEIQATPTPR